MWGHDSTFLSSDLELFNVTLFISPFAIFFGSLLQFSFRIASIVEILKGTAALKTDTKFESEIPGWYLIKLKTETLGINVG